MHFLLDGPERVHDTGKMGSCENNKTWFKFLIMLQFLYDIFIFSRLNEVSHEELTLLKMLLFICTVYNNF